MVALVRKSFGGSRLVLSVNRLDGSKGIPERIKAFERFLEMNPDWHGKATL
jgi:trehalose-6-phosphate synthase